MKGQHGQMHVFTAGDHLVYYEKIEEDSTESESERDDLIINP